VGFGVDMVGWVWDVVRMSEMILLCTLGFLRVFYQYTVLLGAA